MQYFAEHAWNTCFYKCFLLDIKAEQLNVCPELIVPTMFKNLKGSFIYFNLNAKVYKK